MRARVTGSVLFASNTTVALDTIAAAYALGVPAFH
jgi:hypothetical protein